jgi:hypothetical protein
MTTLRKVIDLAPDILSAILDFPVWVTGFFIEADFSNGNNSGYAILLF